MESNHVTEVLNIKSVIPIAVVLEMSAKVSKVVKSCQKLRQKSDNPISDIQSIRLMKYLLKVDKND